MVESALSDAGNYKDLRDKVEVIREVSEFMKTSSFSFKKIDQARTMASYLSTFYPNPEKMVLGLSELLINAVEHGNLGISYSDKTELVLSGSWEKEVETRSLDSANKNKEVSVKYEKTDSKITLTITDEGEGFDWKKYIELSPERLTDPHGRGIAMSRAISFDELEYVGKGNQVICSVFLN